MEVKDSFESLLKKCETNLKTGIDQIRYELAKKGLSKTPSGADLYLDQCIDLLSTETRKALGEIRGLIYKPKEWEPIRATLNQFIEEQCDSFHDFLVNSWGQPSAQVLNQLNLVKSSVKQEHGIYIDRQKLKLSKGEHLTKDIVKILIFGLAAGIFAFLLKIILSH
ncbi:MAG: hypothetical protein ACM3YE_04670 [Bacteroidota bacterium]